MAVLGSEQMKGWHIAVIQSSNSLARIAVIKDKYSLRRVPIVAISERRQSQVSDIVRESKSDDGENVPLMLDDEASVRGRCC